MEQSRPETFPLLIVRSGPHEGHEYPLGAGPNLIGRGDDADVRIRSKEVSRRHAQVDVRDDGIFVVDLGSKNGVYVDGTRVPPGEAGALLNDAGRIELGDIVLELDDAGARVAQALVAGGEITVTRRHVPPRPQRAPGLFVPLITAFIFAVVAYFLWSFA